MYTVEGWDIPWIDRVIVIVIVIVVVVVVVAATAVCLLVQDVTTGMRCTFVSVESLVLIDAWILVVVVVGVVIIIRWIAVEMFGCGRRCERLKVRAG